VSTFLLGSYNHSCSLVFRAFIVIVQVNFVEYQTLSKLLSTGFASVASAGAAAGGILFLCSYAPYFFIGLPDILPTLSAGTKAGCSVISNLAMGFGCWILASFESTG
jgi:hypothetical protein